MKEGQEVSTISSQVMKHRCIIMMSQPNVKGKFGSGLTIPHESEASKKCWQDDVRHFFLSLRFGEGCRTRGVPDSYCQWYTEVCLPAMLQARIIGRPKTSFRGTPLHHNNAHTAILTWKFLEGQKFHTLPHYPILQTSHHATSLSSPKRGEKKFYGSE